MMPIEVCGLYKAYGDKAVLANFSARFPGGAVSCVAGPSGAGKTTLLMLLMGLLKPDGGRIAGMAGRRVSAVFQEDRLCEGLSSVRNVALVLPGRPDRSAAERELLALGLRPGDTAAPVQTLSGGMRRRVALARALCAGGDVFVFDEPFKGLDEAAKAAAIAHVRARTAGKTVLMVTHDLREADAMGAQVFTLAPV